MTKRCTIGIVFPTRARLSFLLIYTTGLCLKGSRVKWGSGIVMEDGAGLPLLEI